MDLSCVRKAQLDLRELHNIQGDRKLGSRWICCQNRLWNPLLSTQFRLKTIPGSLLCARSLVGPARPWASQDEQTLSPAHEEVTTQGNRQEFGADRYWEKSSRCDECIWYNSVCPSPWTCRCHFLCLWLYIHCFGTVLSPSPRPQASDLPGLGSPQGIICVYPSNHILANCYPCLYCPAQWPCSHQPVMLGDLSDPKSSHSCGLYPWKETTGIIYSLGEGIRPRCFTFTCSTNIYRMPRARYRWEEKKD